MQALSDNSLFKAKTASMREKYRNNNYAQGHRVLTAAKRKRHEMKIISHSSDAPFAEESIYS